MSDDMTDTPRSPDPEADGEPSSLGTAFASSSPPFLSAERRTSMIARAMSAFDQELGVDPEDELAIRRSRRTRWRYAASAAAVVAVALPLAAYLLAGRADISSTQASSAGAISTAERSASSSTTPSATTSSATESSATESATAGAQSEQPQPELKTAPSDLAGPSTNLDLGSFADRAALEFSLFTSGLATSLQSVGQSFPASCSGSPIISVSSVVAQAVVGGRPVVVVRLTASGSLQVLDAAACSVLDNDR